MKIIKELDYGVFSIYIGLTTAMIWGVYIEPTLKIAIIFTILFIPMSILVFTRHEYRVVEDFT